MENTNNPIPEFDFEFEDMIIEHTPATEAVPVDKANLDMSEDDEDITPDQDEPEQDIEHEDDKPEYEKGEATAVAFIDDLKDQGVFTEEELKTFDGSWESAQELMKSIPQKAVNTIIAEAPDLTKQIIRFAFAGDEITKESLSLFMKTYLDEIDESTPPAIETMDDARSFLETLYKERGDKPSVIKAALNVLEDEDELLETAQEEQAKLQTKKTTSKSEMLIAEAENARIAKEASQREFVSKLSQEIEATKWKESRITKVKQTLAGNSMNTILSEVYANPKTLVQLADFLSYYNAKDKTIDYSAFMKQSETAAAKTLQDRVERAINSPTLSTKSVSTKTNNLSDNAVPIFD